VRALGIDLGSKRIGLALSDSAGAVATPYEVVERTKDRLGDHRRIAALAAETGAEVLVVGLPLGLDGQAGRAAIAAREEAEGLGRATGLPVELWDERLSTVTAHHDLKAQGLDERARRKVVDMVAASVFLQAWLDHRRSTADTLDRPR
jgi:putative Holliday junction resolvase